MRELSLPGAAAEQQAAALYRSRGYRVEGENVRIAGVEIDLICRRERLVVFCEVKERQSASHGDPLEMVDVRKQERLRRAAEMWLSWRQDGAAPQVRFDVVAARPAGLELVENAF